MLHFEKKGGAFNASAYIFLFILVLSVIFSHHAYGIDATIPNIAITKPDYNTTISASAITVAGTASDNSGGSGVKLVEVRLDSGPYRAAAPSAPGDWSSWTILFDLSGTSMGAHKLTARVTDNAGNQNWAGRTFTYGADTAKPSVAITQPQYNQVLFGSKVSVAGTASDNSAVQLVEVRLDSGPYKPAAPKSSGDWSSWTMSLDMAGVSYGSHKITVRAIDTSGNQNWAGRDFTYNSDTITPLAEITLPNYNTLTPAQTLSVAGVASDNSGVRLVEIKLDGGQYKAATPRSAGDWSTWTASFDLSGAAVGTHKLTARVTDNAGNQNWAGRTFTRLGAPTAITDDFDAGAYSLSAGAVSPNGLWYGWSAGGGSFGVRQNADGNNVFFEKPASSATLSQTHSALAMTTHQYKDFRMSIDVKTDRQLRVNDSPNPWEGAWIFWRWSDNTHFYYFNLQPIGAELGKYDGGQNPASQQIIMTSSTPVSVQGQWAHWDITVQDNHITVAVDGATVFDFNNASSFDTGTIGLYTEDAEVGFDNVVITPL